MNDLTEIQDSDAPRAGGPGSISLLLLTASAVLIFGAIATGYVLLRVLEPGAFAWAPKLLDRRLGLAAAGTLAVSFLAAAGAFRLAQISRTGAARMLFSVALIASLGTLGLRLFELPSTTRRAGLAPVRREVATKSAAASSASATSHVGDAAQGKKVFLGTCAACHAPDGSGVKGQGQNLRDSLFLKDKTDEKVLAFVKVGRQPFDPESKLHLAMPARGGNPALTDASLLDAIAYVRELQKKAVVATATSAAGEARGGAAAPAAAAASAKPASSDQPQVVDGELWLPHSILPAAQAGPFGSASATIALQKPGAEGRMESNLKRFFTIQLFADGLHAVYLLFGVLLGIWMLVAMTKGAVPKASLVMAAIYWIVISGIGLLLLPAFYV